MPDHYFREIFPYVQPESPPVQLKAILSTPITSYMGGEANSHLTTASFQVVGESNKIYPMHLL